MGAYAFKECAVIHEAKESCTPHPLGLAELLHRRCSQAAPRSTPLGCSRGSRSCFCPVRFCILEVRERPPHLDQLSAIANGGRMESRSSVCQTVEVTGLAHKCGATAGQARCWRRSSPAACTVLQIQGPARPPVKLLVLALQVGHSLRCVHARLVQRLHAHMHACRNAGEQCECGVEARPAEHDPIHVLLASPMQPPVSRARQCPRRSACEPARPPVTWQQRSWPRMDGITAILFCIQLSYTQVIVAV